MKSLPLVKSLPRNHDTAPLKIMLAMLCGQERHHWICPHLSLATTSWAFDERVNKENGGQYHQELIYDYSTSQEARNEAVKRFLASEADFLIMVDNDTMPVHPTKSHLINAIDLASWQLPIVAAPVATMGNAKLNWHINAYMLMPDGKAFRPISLDEHQGTVQVDAIGFGLVCIMREVIEAMSKSMTRYGWGPDHMIDGAVPDGLGKQPRTLPHIMRSRTLSGETVFGEDLLFSHRARQIGYNSYVAHPAYTCGHFHTEDIGRLPQLSIANFTPSDDTIHRDSVLQCSTTNKPEEKPQQVNEEENEEEYGQLSASHVLHDISSSIKRDSWMLSSGSLCWLYKFIQEYPKEKQLNILEYGSGMSTLVMLLALLKRDGPHRLLSVESNDQYKIRTLGMIHKQFKGKPKHEWPTNYKIIYEPLINGFYKYDSKVSMLESDTTFDFVLVDGPPGDLGDRGMALNPNNGYTYHYRKGTLIFWDDCDRTNEKRAMDVAIDCEIVKHRRKVGHRTALLEWLLPHIPKNQSNSTAPTTPHLHTDVFNQFLEWIGFKSYC